MKYGILKRIITCFLVLSVTFTCVPCFADETESETFFVSLLPTDDATIRANMVDINYGTKTNLEMDVREGSRRYGLIRYDANEIKAEADTAQKVVFRYYGSSEERCRRLLLYPLYGKHKNFDENSLTWSVASGIVENGVSLTQYLDNVYVTPTPPEEAKWHEIDVTDYVKSQDDYIYGFKLWATPGSTNTTIIRSKEQQTFEPQLLFYTDVDEVVKRAGSQIMQSVNMAALTHDVTLPSTWETGLAQDEPCSVEWISENSEVISITDDSQGVICQRPEMNEGSDCETNVTMRITYRTKVYEKKLKARVLAKNILPASEDTYIRSGSYADRNYGNDENLYCGSNGIDELSGDIYVKFQQDMSEYSASAKRVILRFYNDNYNKKQTGTLNISRVTLDSSLNSLTYNTLLPCEALSGGEVMREYRSCTDFDITALFDRENPNVFKISSFDDEWRFFSCDSDYPPRIIMLDEKLSTLYDAAQLICSELGDRKSVTQDFALPMEKDGFDVEWKSNSENLIISENTAQVIRPQYENGDAEAMLSCGITDGESVYSEDLPINIVRSEPDGINGSRKLSDPMKMSDESFFGKYNSTIDGWEIKPTLRYEEYPELSDVLYYTKKGRYEEAKEELLNYYRLRDVKLNYEVKPTDSYSLGTQLASEHIIGNQSAISAFSVTHEEAWTEIEIPASSGASEAYMIFDRSKDGSTAAFYSHETQYAPYLKVATNKGTFNFTCTSDAYLRGGDYSKTNYGTENVLLVHEEGNPYNSNAERAFLNFDLSQLEGNETIKSISLMIYGKKINGSDEEMKLVLYDAPLMIYMDENKVTWSDHTPGTFNFRDVIYDWSAPYGSESEWIFSLARQANNTSLVSYYLGTGKEQYAIAALEDLMGIYTYQVADFPRALDTGWRTPNILSVVFGLLNCEYMSPEIFCALLKYSYAEMDYLKDATASVVNQINAIDTGFTRLVVYFPEIRDNSYLDAAISRHDNTFGRVICHDEGSYKEATTGYIERLLLEMKEIIEMLEMSGYTDTEMYRKKTLELAKFYSCCVFPSGNLVPYGDGGRLNVLGSIEKLADFFDDDELKYIATGYTEGTEPSYTSKIYGTKKIATMRSGWNTDALYAFMNSEFGHSHGHPDNLHMDIYAYGRPLLIDAGNGGGYNPISPAGYVRSETYPHNTVEVGDEAQSYSIGTTGLEMVSNNLFDRTVGYTDANEGYRHTRKVFFLKNGFWLVTDSIVPENPTESTLYRQNWHPDNYAKLEIDEESGIAATHFPGTANLQILQADMSGISALRKQSYIRTSQIKNRMEDYVCYEKEQSGTAYYNTLLYPTKAGDEDRASINKLETDNPESSAAMEIGYKNKQGSFYISYEDIPAEQQFGNFSTDCENVYVEKNADGKLCSISLVNGKILSENDEPLVSCESTIKDIGIEMYANKINISTSEPLSDTVKIKADKAAEVSLNGVLCNTVFDDGYINVAASAINLPVTLSGTKMQYTTNADIVRSFAISSGGKSDNIIVCIPAGTTISAPIGWDGSLGFSVDEGDVLKVKLENSSYNVSFDKPVSIEVPFYSSSGAYYTVNGSKKEYSASLTDKSAAISFAKSKSTVSSPVAATFVFPVKAGALVASGSGGGGGGGGSISGGSSSTQKDDEITPLFSDVSNHWAEKDIIALAEKKIISGYDDKTFRPNGVLTRAELVTMLSRAFVGEESAYNDEFSDVASSDWCAGFVASALKEGLINGYPDKTFRPGGIVTREETAKLICTVMKKAGKQLQVADISSYADNEEISPWAYEYMQQAVGSTILRGVDETHLLPHGSLTRAMAASVINRILTVN